MDAWWMCEVPYPDVPKSVLDSADSVRASLPNRWCDPRVAADLFEQAIDHYLLCDELGLNIGTTEHHAGINSLLGANPMLVSILARQTRKCRILSLGTLVKDRGYRQVWGSIAAENHRMLELASDLGFKRKMDRHEPALTCARTEKTAYSSPRCAGGTAFLRRWWGSF